MAIFNLPKTTVFGRVVPKNAFDKFTNSKQKKVMSDYIQRIRWVNKLATSTINLPSKEVTEIQFFLVELKRKNDLKTILEIIQKAISYHIIFILKYEEEVMFSTAAKHSHPHKKDEAVIDCTFSTDWFKLSDNSIQINLNRSLDWVFVDFCCQILGRKNQYKSYSEFVTQALEIEDLTHQIHQLEKQIKRASQFKRKVALNMRLNELKARYDLGK